MDFSARYIFIKPADTGSLQERLEKSGRDSDVIQTILQTLPETTDEAKVKELFSSTIVNDELDNAVKELSAYIYESDDKPAEELTNGHGPDSGEQDAEMEDVEKADAGDEA
jgi:guanylate kinase